MSDVPPTTVPPVVAVVVVHEPGEWFVEVLDALAAQDYPNLRHLFLVTGGDVREEILARLPDAFIRPVEHNPGFGPAANTVLDLVEGQNGFFLFLHDDVVLDPDAVRLLVEEVYRSNAGIVGPKLVDWDDPRRLQRVGLFVDRVGEVDPLVEPGELDQEQHDAVRDVFALPTACLLVRADLFRTLGFHPGIEYHGDDLDLCWRAHLLGARVMVVPTARARHRAELASRRPDMAHRRMATRHRVDTVVTLTGARRLPWVLAWMVIVTAAELVVGVFTGRAREAWATLASVAGLLGRFPSLMARRREVRSLRVVPDQEVAALQQRGSARLSRFVRARQGGTVTADGDRARRVDRSPTPAVLAWVVVLVVSLFGSRHLLSGGVTPVGTLLPLPQSPGDLLGSYLSGWWEHGLGSTGAPPTAYGLLGVAGLLIFSNTGLLHTLTSVGLLVVGYLGAWRLASALPGDRARVAGLVVYAAVPLPYASLAGGRWAGLVAYAAVPWLVHLLRVGSGLGSAADLDRADLSDPDPLAAHVLAPDAKASRHLRVRSFFGVVLVTATVLAFVPSFVVAMVLVGMVLALGTLVGSGRLGVVATVAGMTITGAVVALALNVPWSLRFFEQAGADAFFGAAPSGPRNEGLVDLARFGVGGSRFGIVALALYIPVIVAPLVARGWRFAWAVRGAFLVVIPGLVLVAADQGAIPEIVVDPVLLMAPMALGLALCAAVVAAAFSEDIRGATFGWRQPLGVVTAIAIGAGVLPVLVASAGGRWEQPTTSLSQLLAQLPADPDEGDYRVLFVGDPRVLPVPGWSYGDGLAYALVDDGPLTVADSWLSVPSGGVRSVEDVLDAIAADRTARAARGLAPLGVRFIVVPLVDGAASTIDRPLPEPSGLLDALGDQLDLKRRYASAELVILENTTWIPVRAQLGPATAPASNAAGLSPLAAADFSDRSPLMVGQDGLELIDSTATGGVIHLGVPRAAGWQLELDGVTVPSRPSFGTVTAWDLDGGGQVTIRFEPSRSRQIVVVAQAICWTLLLVLACSNGSWRRRKRPTPPAVASGETGPVLELAGELELAPLPGRIEGSQP